MYKSLPRTCRCTIINTTNNLVCKNKSSIDYFIFKKKCCAYHYNLYGYKYATIIQSVYRGIKGRKWLNNIYKKVPDDVQNIIKYYINEELYIKKYLKTLTKIVVQKIHNFTFNMDLATYNLSEYIFEANHNKLIEFSNYVFENNNLILKNWNLYFKYYDLFSEDNLYKTNMTINHNFSYNINAKMRNYRYLLKESLFYYKKIVSTDNMSIILNTNTELYKELIKINIFKLYKS